MIHNSIDNILTASELLWLKYVYRQNLAEEKVSLRAFKVEFKDQIPENFNFSQISERLYRPDKVSLLGIYLIDPKSEIILSANKVIKGVNEILKTSPDIETIEVSDLIGKTNINFAKVSEILREFSFLGMFYKQSKVDPRRILAFVKIALYESSKNEKNHFIPIYSFDIDEKVFNEYVKYSTIEQVAEDFIKEELKKKKNMSSTSEETPEQKRFRVLKTIYDLADGNPSEIIMYEDLEEKVEISGEKVDGILRYLEQRHLVKMSENWVEITSAGIDQVEKIKKNPEKPTDYFPANSYTNIFYGNVGGFQQGQNNTQNISQNINPDFTKAITDLLTLIENSSLNPAQKMNAKSDVQLIRDLADLEKTEDVKQLANSKIEAIKDVIATTADMTSLGMVVIPILHAMFQ